MWFIILKATKNQDFTLSLKDTVSEKPQEAWGRGLGGGGVQTEVKRKIGGVMKPDYKTAKDTLINLWWVVCHSAKNFSKWLLFHERNRINEKVLFSPLTPACYFWLFFEICFLHMMKTSLFPSSVCTLIDPEKE